MSFDSQVSCLKDETPCYKRKRTRRVSRQAADVHQARCFAAASAFACSTKRNPSQVHTLGMTHVRFQIGTHTHQTPLHAHRTTAVEQTRFGAAVRYRMRPTTFVRLSTSRCGRVSRLALSPNIPYITHQHLARFTRSDTRSDQAGLHLVRGATSHVRRKIGTLSHKRLVAT